MSLDVTQIVRADATVIGKHMQMQTIKKLVYLNLLFTDMKDKTAKKKGNEISATFYN